MAATPGTRTTECQIAEVGTTGGLRTLLAFSGIEKTGRIDLAFEPGQCGSACGLGTRRPVGRLGPRCISCRTRQLTAL
jgi:hypothetical protein